MPKKRKKKTNSSKSVPAGNKIEKTLIENLVELQKVHADLAEKFDKLTKEISSLLALFEMAARSFSKNPSIESATKDKEFLDKIDKLLDQNKTIAKGLTIMEERVRERIYPSAPQKEETAEDKYYPSPSGKPLPKF